MRIAVIGSGISGLTAAWLLRESHDVTLFESRDRLGGHTHTVTVDLPGGSHRVDTGFIVCNERTYPHFLRLLDELEVPTQPSDMSFSFSSADGRLEWAGTGPNGLFAQRRNLARPRFWRMLADVAHFGRLGRRLLDDHDPRLATLADLLAAHDWSEDFEHAYLVPLCASIWSADPGRFDRFPLAPLLGFLDNHGLLDLRDRPAWRTVRGGSATYVDRIAAVLGDRLRLSTPVQGVTRHEGKVEVRTPRGTEVFDHVVVATHSDQALRLLDDPSDAEGDVLGALPYQRNVAVLHTDRTVLPRRRRAWASWNYHAPVDGPGSRVAVTYHMNRLQRIDAAEELCVTLNREEAIDPGLVLGRFEYDHPVFTTAGARAQSRRAEISGVRHTSYCGAYWHDGFHEDGVVSALEACQELGGRWL